MPTVYAHYRFGFRAIPNLSPQVQSCIRRHRQMYDLGLHGPDFLLFYNPVTNNKCAEIAAAIHLSPGREFFSQAARQLRLNSSESAASYLYGVLAHFALDSMCHPFVNENTKKGAARHMEIETEFDRFLLELDGKPSPYEHSIAKHIQLNNLSQAKEIAMFYPDISAKHVTRSMRNFRFVMDFCTSSKGLRRRIIEKGLFTKTAADALMMREANPRCIDITPELKNRYDQAELIFPNLMEQLTAHLSYGRAFDSEFDLIFG